MFSSDIAAAAKIYQRQWQLIEVNFWLRRPLVVKIQLKSFWGNNLRFQGKTVWWTQKLIVKFQVEKLSGHVSEFGLQGSTLIGKMGRQLCFLVFCSLLLTPGHLSFVDHWNRNTLIAHFYSLFVVGIWLWMTLDVYFAMTTISCGGEMGCCFCIISALIGGDRGVIWWEKVVVQASTTPATAHHNICPMVCSTCF